MNPGQSGNFVQSPIFLACASRHASTICQLRKFCHLLPMNGFKNSSSSVVLLPCPPPSSSHSSTPFPHNILGTKISGFGTYTSVQSTSYKSSDCSSLSVNIHFLRYFLLLIHMVGAYLCFYVSNRQFHSVRKLSPISRLFSP